MPSTSRSIGEPNDRGARVVTLDCNGCDALASITVTPKLRQAAGSLLGAVLDAVTSSEEIPFTDEDGMPTCVRCLEREKREREAAADARHQAVARARATTSGG